MRKQLALEDDKTRIDYRQPRGLLHAGSDVVEGAATLVGRTLTTLANLGKQSAEECLDGEQQIAATSQEHKLDVAESDEARLAVESLAGLSQEIRALVAAGHCNAGTLRLVTESARQALQRVGEEFPQAALEAEASTNMQHLQVALALESALGRLGQMHVLTFKHQWNFLADLFRSTEGVVQKYGDKLKTAEAEMRDTPLGAQQFECSLTELWYHFSTTNEHWQKYVGKMDPATGVTQGGHEENFYKDLPGAIEEDLKTSKYLLVTYPGEVLALLKTAVSKLGNGKALHDEAAIKKLEQSFASMKHPADLFNKKLIGPGAPLMSMMGLRENTGAPPAWSSGSSPLGRLSQKRYIDEFTFGHHMVQKVLHTINQRIPTPLNQAVHGLYIWGAKNVHYHAKDIDRVIKAGEQYLALTQQYLALQSQLVPLRQKIEEFSAADSSADRDMVGTHILSYLDNILTCFGQPAGDETARAVKAAKYCHYLALRMIHHAKRGD